jgi:hypothetical protein
LFVNKDKRHIAYSYTRQHQRRKKLEEKKNGYKETGPGQQEKLGHFSYLFFFCFLQAVNLTNRRPSALPISDFIEL